MFWVVFRGAEFWICLWTKDLDLDLGFKVTELLGYREGGVVILHSSVLVQTVPMSFPLSCIICSGVPRSK